MSSSRLERVLSLLEFEAAARARLPHSLFNYIQGGCEDGQSLRGNRAAFDAWRLVPRSMVDITSRTQHVDLWGRRYASPFGIAPMGSSALFAYRGDLALAEAARLAGVPMVLSGASLIPMETVARHNPDAWFQAYLPGQLEAMAPLVERIDRAGFQTLVVTGDTAVPANRENNVRAGFSTPLRPSLRLGWQGAVRPRWLLSTFGRTLVRHGMPTFVNAQVGPGVPVLSRHAERAFADRGSFSWEHLRRVRSLWPGRLVLKGVMHVDDAVQARDCGCDGVIVSNHGGRQLDSAVDALTMLPRVVAAVPDVAVMMDGGIRRGTDVVKALALGARLVFVGRPFLYAATVAGRQGVQRAIGLLHDEVSRDMGMLGATAVEVLTPDRHLERL